MKKILALLLAFSMTFALLAGCGVSNGSGNTGSSTRQATETSQTAAEMSEQGTPAEIPVLNALGNNNIPAVNSAVSTYIILVQDADDSEPLSGAAVQFCSDTLCMEKRTDESGEASFEAEPGSYTAHVLEAPHGYTATEEEIALTAENRTATFALSRSGAAESGNETVLEDGE